MQIRHTIYERFKQQVYKHPDSVAVFDENRSLTYKELDLLVNAIASTFPVRPKFAGVVMNHGVEQIAAILAVLKSGAAYVPAEPSFPDKRIDFMMHESNVDFIITNNEYAQRFPGHLLMLVDAGIPISPTAPMSGDASQPDGVAYVLYTSGSTGKPKGVMVTNANVCHYASAFNHEFKVRTSDTMLQYSVCSFDIFVEEVFATFLNGGTLAIPSEKTKKEISTLVKFIEDHNVTILSGFPYLLLKLNKLTGIPASLRLLISGGDVLRASYVDKLIDKVVVYNTYGPSETTVCASYFRCNGADALKDGTYPIGRPVKGADIEIRDKQMRPVPNGTPGEICIFGDGVSNGYIGNRRRENRAFVTLKDGRRMYRSGDLGTMLSDGTILFHHRIDSQVMILGKRVETSEVESALCKCPEVESGVVRAGVDSKGLSYLIAYLVPGKKVKFSIEKIKERMRSFLPEYMLPEFFVKVQAIPLTANGKVDNGALPFIFK